MTKDQRHLRMSLNSFLLISDNFREPPKQSHSHFYYVINKMLRRYCGLSSKYQNIHFLFLLFSLFTLLPQVHSFIPHLTDLYIGTIFFIQTLSRYRNEMESLSSPFSASISTTILGDKCCQMWCSMDFCFTVSRQLKTQC